jgi:tetratricopeptide (TPR) repeat protein
MKPAILILTLALAGCAGFGVFVQSDPAAKLSDAEHLLYKQRRPIIAERLIREAIDIYQQNGDEIGLANAYRAYGFFFRAAVIEGQSSNHYRKSGFLDKSASFETRYAKSLEYFGKAGKIFSAHQRFDALTNVTLYTGLTYVLEGDFTSACRAFDTSLENMRDNLAQNPTAKPYVPAGFDNYEQYLAHTKKRYGCPYL